jgi:hypothetical protein
VLKKAGRRLGEMDTRNWNRTGWRSRKGDQKRLKTTQGVAPGAMRLQLGRKTNTAVVPSLQTHLDLHTTAPPTPVSEQPRNPLTGRFGVKPDADDTTPVSFRVSPAVRQRLREFASVKGVSLSCLLNLLVHQLLEGGVDLQDLPGPESSPHPAGWAVGTDPWDKPKETPAPAPVDPMAELLKVQLAQQAETTKALAAAVAKLGSGAEAQRVLSPASADLGSALTALVMEFGQAIHVKEAKPLGDGSARWELCIASPHVSVKRARRFLVDRLGEKTVQSRLTFRGFPGNQPKAKKLPPQQPAISEASVRVLPAEVEG